jgi:hypothetical protein
VIDVSVLVVSKASDTHSSTYFVLLHYCFLVVCMIGGISIVLQSA